MITLKLYFCDMLQNQSDDFFMKKALEEAHKALALDEVPVGAVVVCDNQIIARAHNFTERLNDVTQLSSQIRLKRIR